MIYLDCGIHLVFSDHFVNRLNLRFDSLVYQSWILFVSITTLKVIYRPIGLIYNLPSDKLYYREG
jgi:hypothetical protein